MKTFFVVNPRSAAGATGRAWADLRPRAREVVGAFEEGFTDAPGHATELTRRALERGFELVVSVGGDGTHNEVVNGFFADGRATHPGAVFGIVHAGTGGDLRRVLHIDRLALDHLAGDSVRPFDVGRVHCTGFDGQPVTKMFGNITSIGLSAVVAHTVNGFPKVLGGQASFLLGTAAAFATYKRVAVELMLDDRPSKTLDCTVLAFCNGRCFGGGMRIAPLADFADGLLDVVAITGISSLAFAGQVRRMYEGRHLRHPAVEMWRARRIRASAATPLPIDLDGEQPGVTPLEVELLPAALRIKCSNKSRAASNI